MASASLGQMIASVFSYFRDKSWFLRWRGGGDKRSDMDDEMQEILLRFGAITDREQLLETIRDAVGISLDNTSDLLIYLIDNATGSLVSQDGLAGVVHTLPRSGLAGRCVEEKHLIIAKELEIDDPLSGLLPSTSPILPANRRVACFQVRNPDNGRAVCVIVVVCDAVSSSQEKRLSLVGRHIAVCVNRLNQMETQQQRLPHPTTKSPTQTTCSGSHNGGPCTGSSTYDDSILQLCADLHDNDPASMQTKVINYLERRTQSECCALWIVSSEDATEVFCQVLGNRVLEEEIRMLIPLSCFNTVVTERRSITLDDIAENSRTELELKMELKINSLLCVPVINQARSKAVAVACCINKIGAPRFTKADEDVVRHCFRYTVPVLTSVMSLQKERQLKQETQSMLQVAKNLFTHLGRFHNDVIAWSKPPPHPDPSTSLYFPSQFPWDDDITDMESIENSESSTLQVESFDWPGSNSLTNQIVAQEAIANRITGQSASKERLVGERRHSRPAKVAPYPAQPMAKDKQRRRSLRHSPPSKHVLQQIKGQKRKLSALDEPTVQQSLSSEALAKLEQETLHALEELGHSPFKHLSAVDPQPQSDESLTSPSNSLVNPESSSSGSLEYCDATDSWDEQQKATDLQETTNQADTKCSSKDLNADNPTNVPRTPTDVPGTSEPSSLKEQPQPAKAGSSSESTHEVDSQSGAGLPRRQSSILELDWSPGTLSVHCIEQPPPALLQETYDVRILLREIMMEARNLTQAERCSLFLVENDELVAKVFDGHVLDEMGEVRIPITQGIAGHVATTGKILNIKDAYSHPLFYRGVDNSTGFRTKNILCFPIKDSSRQSECPSAYHQDGPQSKDCWCIGEGKNCTGLHAVVGIAELCNKVNGLYFTKHDEEVAAVFSIYCGISIVHSLLYKKMKDAQYRSKLANELMMYHMKGAEEDIKPLLSKESVPSPESFHPQMASFTYSPRGIPDGETICATLSMFYDMGFVQRYRIRHTTLVNFCQLVRRGYRDPPYHNWYHAFSVGHFCFLLYKNLNQLSMLKEIEVFGLFVACICHDLDHRGTNNSFQVHSESVLAALYSSEGSVMERHHFAQAMCIVNTDGCNIFENLSRDDYQTALDLMQDIILATDLAHHLRIIKELKQMAEDGYKAEDPHCHKLLLCLLMTSCDLSDQTKNWTTTKRIAELIYKEFFTQGDLEKAMGMETPEMYDREKACIPELQINFLNHIALPVYQILAKMFPTLGQLVDTMMVNKQMWGELAAEETKKKETNNHK